VKFLKWTVDGCYIAAAYMCYEIETSVVLAAADDLQQQDAEAVHVLHERHRAVHGVFRRHVPTAVRIIPSMKTHSQNL